MKKAYIFCIAALMATTVPIAYAGSTPKGKAFVYLNNQIVQVQGAVASIQEQIDTLVRSVATIDERVKANEEAILSLEENNAILKAQMDQFNIDAINAEIIKLQNEIVSLKTQMQLSGANIENLQAQINSNFSLIADLQTAVQNLGTLKEQIDYNNTLITAIELQIESINEFLALKQDIVSGSCPEGSSIRQILENGEVVCEPDNSGLPGAILNAFMLSQGAIQVGSQAFISVWCPQGFIASGGGFHKPNSAVDVLSSAPATSLADGKSGWELLFINNGSYAADVLARAQCIKLGQ